MTDLADTVRQLDDRVTRADAFVTLASAGAAAIRPLIEGLRSRGDSSYLLLRDVLRAISSGFVQELTTHVADDSFHVWKAVIDALGHSRDPSAFEALRGALEARPGPVGDALGELGVAAAIEPLRGVAEKIAPLDDADGLEAAVRNAREQQDVSELKLLLRVLVALAKLGHHVPGPVLQLAGCGRGEDDYDALEVRSIAAAAMKYVVGPGMLFALRTSLREDNSDVVDPALAACRLLGARQVASELVHVVEKRGEHAGAAYSSLHAIVGVWPNDAVEVHGLEPGELGRWWGDFESNLDGDTSYRLGEPAHPRQLSSSPGELQVVTGFRSNANLDALGIVADSARDRAQRWVDAHASEFDPGGLYKYGHRQQLSAIMV
jgi:hypothetical protein